jgi:hypothetical protein
MHFQLFAFILVVVMGRFLIRLNLNNIFQWDRHHFALFLIFWSDGGRGVHPGVIKSKGVMMENIVEPLVSGLVSTISDLKLILVFQDVERKSIQLLFFSTSEN